MLCSVRKEKEQGVLKSEFSCTQQHLSGFKKFLKHSVTGAWKKAPIPTALPPHPQEKGTIGRRAAHCSLSMESAGNHGGGSLGDIFEATLSLEETHKEEGYREGFADGTDSGREEARQLGLRHGFAIGEELGFYRGCADVWAAAIRADPAAFSARTRRGFVLLGELLDRYPLLDPEDDSIQEVLEAIRLRFRAVTASLGVRLEYRGQPRSRDAAADGVDF